MAIVFHYLCFLILSRKQRSLLLIRNGYKVAAKEIAVFYILYFEGVVSSNYGEVS